MSIEEIETRLARIRDCADDPETAHAIEDSLHQGFIEYVASLEIPIAKKAKRVLESRKIEFPRWCA